MTTKQPVGTIDAGTPPQDFMLPDPPFRPDMQRRRQLTRMTSALQAHFGDNNKHILVCGMGYLRQDAMNPDERFAPDFVVAFGVDANAIIERNGYTISEVGKPPDFVMEIATDFTGTPDFSDKREGYRRYQVGEYWRADESGGRWHGSPLAGDRLVDGAYIPIPIEWSEDGIWRGYSAVLGVDVCWDNGAVRFYDHLAGRFLPDALELARMIDAAKDREKAARAGASRLRETLRRLE